MQTCFYSSFLLDIAWVLFNNNLKIAEGFKRVLGWFIPCTNGYLFIFLFRFYPFVFLKINFLKFGIISSSVKYRFANDEQGYLGRLSLFLCIYCNPTPT